RPLPFSLRLALLARPDRDATPVVGEALAVGAGAVAAIDPEHARAVGRAEGRRPPIGRREGEGAERAVLRPRDDEATSLRLHGAIASAAEAQLLVAERTPGPDGLHVEPQRLARRGGADRGRRTVRDRALVRDPVGHERLERALGGDVLVVQRERLAALDL